MANLEQLLRRRQGVKLVVSLDKLRQPTVGIGHVVTDEDNLKIGDKITAQQVAEFFKEDGAKAIVAAKRQAGLAGIADKKFLVYLAFVNFQLGPRWYRVLRKVWQLIVDGQYEQAASSLQSTRWFRQSPVPAKDFQRALRRLDPKAGGSSS